MTGEPNRRRSGCPISYALDTLGDRWTLLVLRDLLLFGKRRFQDVLRSEEGIASNILADRLKRLEQHGIISRTRDPEDRRQFIYRGTDKGLGLIPILLELSAWGATHDRKTAAPKAFVQEFYANREAVIARCRADHDRD